MVGAWEIFGRGEFGKGLGERREVGIRDGCQSRASVLRRFGLR